jgi:hypothetical protein
LAIEASMPASENIWPWRARICLAAVRSGLTTSERERLAALERDRKRQEPVHERKADGIGTPSRRNSASVAADGAVSRPSSVVTSTSTRSSPACRSSLLPPRAAARPTM